MRTILFLLAVVCFVTAFILETDAAPSPTKRTKYLLNEVVDDKFLDFVKNPSNFGQFYKEMEEKKLKILNYEYGMTVDEKIADLTHKYEAYLGVLYLMRQRWQCAKIVEQFNEEHKRECQKFRKYLDILYEYLFRVYVKGRDVDPMLAQQLPAVKPIFKLQRGEKIDDATLFGVIQSLSEISKFFFNSNESKRYDYSLKRRLRTFDEPKLLNEEEFELNAANSNGTFRQQFDRELKRMLKETAERKRSENKLVWHQRSVGIMIKREKQNRDNQTAAAHDYNFLYRNSPFKRSIIARNDLDLLLALFHDPPTFYEILKMAKKLGEMDDDFYILLNSSDLKRIFKRLKRPEEPFEKIEIQIKNEFCALAFFVGDLLETANIKNIPTIELVENGNLILMANTMTKKVLKVESIEVNIGNFLEKKELCKEKQKENEIKKYLDGKDLYNGKTPKIDFNPINDLQQIVPEIAEEIEQMLQKSDWIYAN